ncbi:hypothetical protein M9H77_12412 [Catharanthus roseus]|uniref:Uncharacterized protein n=1 Tax=Catharanthus roseus TaxID=4058 RepID=A0ACC0BHH0_CATRO|nr:hypothetical protein M9H77_12412 [Catharanthus roseus]
MYTLANYGGGTVPRNLFGIFYAEYSGQDGGLDQVLPYEYMLVATEGEIWSRRSKASRTNHKSKSKENSGEDDKVNHELMIAIEQTMKEGLKFKNEAWKMMQILPSCLWFNA